MRQLAAEGRAAREAKSAPPAPAGAASPSLGDLFDAAVKSPYADLIEDAPEWAGDPYADLAERFRAAREADPAPGPQLEEVELHGGPCSGERIAVQLGATGIMVWNRGQNIYVRASWKTNLGVAVFEWKAP
jgi:hypothetical protein